MSTAIFYSWQSDVRAAACRTLIQTALEGAVQQLRTDATLAVEPVVERDTSGVPGAPDIGATILSKIDQAAVFVGDVTIVTSSSAKRPTPNPNVLIELGYALKALGERRVILVQNTAFGGPEQLPFDLRQKRTVTYQSPEDAAERSTARAQLTSTFTEAITTILRDGELPSDTSDRHAKQRRLLRDAMNEQTWVELESPLLVQVRSHDHSGKPVRAPAPLDGAPMVRGVSQDTFDLAIPVRNRGLTLVRVPYGLVDQVWSGTEGRLHILLTRTTLLKQGTSAFISEH